MKIKTENDGTLTISIGQLAEEIHAHGRYLKDNVSKEDLQEPGEEFSGGDVRLQIQNGSWQLHFGDAQYDQDHSGAWASASVPWGCTLAESREIARELLNGLE